MALNRSWHEAHPLARGAAQAERLRWHLEHQRHCACRPPPAALARRVADGLRAAELARCGWAGSDPLYVRYHDEEWGVPAHDDGRLFEMLILEGAQAGLAWITILRKRENYRRAFDGFDVRRVARYGARELARLRADPGIVRNRLKLAAARDNARAFLALQEEFGSFDRFIWAFVGGAPRVNRPRTLCEVPARTPESEAMSRALAKRGFRFVGPTICYAFMQACGLVDDHVQGCFRARP